MGITGWVCRMKVNGVNGLDGKLSVAVSKGTEYDMSIRRKGFRLTKKRYTERLWLIKQTR